MTGVSKIYPRGIQFKNRRSVSNVALTRLGWFAVLRTSEHSWKIDENSCVMDVFRFLALTDVIWSWEKSNTSSDNSRRIAMLFSQIERLVWHDETISLIKVGQLCGHSCFNIETRTRLSLFKNARSLLNFSSDFEFSMIKLTMKLRIPSTIQIRHDILTWFPSCYTHLGIVPAVEPSIESWLHRQVLGAQGLKLSAT